MQTTQTECGICAVSMLSSYYGFKKPLSFYREKFKIGRDGMSLKALSYVLSDIGLEPEIIKSNKIDPDLLKNAVPCIICVNNHYLVLEKIKKRKCYLCDPAKGKQIRSVFEINKEFAGYIVTVKKTEKFKKTNDTLRDFRYIKLFFKKISARFAMSILLCILCNVVMIFIPLLLQGLIDSLVYIGGKTDFSFIASKLIIILTIYYIITRIRNNKLVELQGDIIKNVSTSVIAHMLRIPYSFFDNRTSAELIYRLKIMDGMSKSLTNVVITLAIGITTITVVGTYIAMTSPILLSILLVLTLLIVLFVVLKNQELVDKNTKLAALSQGLESMQSEMTINMFQIKCMKLESHFEKIYNKQLEEYKSDYVSNQKFFSNYSLRINIVEIFAPFVVVVLLVFLKGGDSVSVGYLFGLYTLITYYVKYVTTSAMACTQLYQTKASVFYINDILDEKEEKEENEQHVMSEEFRELKLQEVEFRYNDRQKNILQNINMIVKKGEKVAIVGLSGAGKTTLVKLIGRLYQPVHGKIEINGYSVGACLNERNESLIGIVPQMPVVFNKTIYENLTMGHVEYSIENVMNALKMVNLWNEIEEMPMRLNTMLSGQGGNLSGGQIQRLILARELIKKPELLILDEATSSLDAMNEEIIFKNLRDANVTMIVISHRLSTIIDSDRIYVLSEGTIIEEGTHWNLLEKKGIYYELNKEQTTEKLL